MKSKIYLTLTIFFFLFNSCLNNTPITNPNSDDNNYVEWHLIEVFDSSETRVSFFEFGTVIWRFEDTESGDGNIVVENNNTDADLEDALDSGTYEYLVVDATEGDQIYINEDADFVEFGNINQVNNSQIIIDQNIFIEDEITEPYTYVFQGVVTNNN